MDQTTFEASIWADLERRAERDSAELDRLLASLNYSTEAFDFYLSDWRADYAARYGRCPECGDVPPLTCTH